MRSFPTVRHDPANVRCDLCGGAERDEFIRGRDRQHGVPGEWSLSRCRGCSLVYLDPPPTPEEIAGFYRGVGYYAYEESARTFREVRVSRLKRHVLRHWYGYARLGLATRLGRIMAGAARGIVSTRNVIPWRGEGRLLDVGCGVGSVIWRLAALGWTVEGVEMDAAAAEVGRRHGLAIATGTLEETALPDASFDVIRMSHVLEHLPSPSRTLAEVRRLLRPGGVVYLNLPDISAWNFRLFRSCWFPLELPRHLFHFTPQTIARLAKKCGLRLARLSHNSGPGKFLESWQYLREERARAAAGKAALAAAPPGPRMQDRRWLAVALKIPFRMVDLLGRGDIMECELEPVADPNAGGP
ncbi:MAG: class I SAM-dependent methyltransferase [Planctomycetes bacterium]|nr:class I SAM-dependent methyltransferase [Planctomycetota bacterium]